MASRRRPLTPSAPRWLMLPVSASTEIKLAEALASAGRIQEATVYFNALLESQQGSGLINLQLARLAARQGNDEPGHRGLSESDLRELGRRWLCAPAGCSL